MSVLRALVNNPYKESFYGKWKSALRTLVSKTHIYIYIFSILSIEKGCQKFILNQTWPIDGLVVRLGTHNLFCLFWFFLGFKFSPPIYATFSLLLIALWVVLCNLIGMISISKSHAWWFCCDLWCEVWHGIFWFAPWWLG